MMVGHSSWKILATVSAALLLCNCGPGTGNQETGRVAPSVTALAQISFVQVNSSSPTSASSVSAAYSSAQTAGNLNIIAIGWSDVASALTSVADARGNVYKLAVSQASASGMTHAIYYATNIVAATAGTNVVTVKFSRSVSYPDLRILEYSGVNTLDKTASAAGSGSTADSGGATTTVANELLFGANYTFGTTSAAGSGYTSRRITVDGDIVEDQVVSATGTYHATASMSNKAWIMQLVTFSSAGQSQPPAPTGLTATAVSSSQINLSWTASSGAASYNVLRSTSSGGPYTQIAGGVGTISYTDTTVTNGTTYFYVVQAVSSGGTSGNSNQASATPTAPPLAPTGLTATAMSSSQINLTWTASSGATSYNVLRSTTTGGPYTQIASGVAATSFSDTGLAASTIYFYVVQAVNSAGTRGNSNEASATTPLGPPLAPTNLTATAGDAQVSLSWTISDGATSYNVLRSTSSGGPYTQIAGGVSTTSYTDTTVSNGTTYFYVVQAVSSGGTSGNSNQAISTPTAPPLAPTGLTATAMSSSQINLTWTASSGATSYNVLRSTTTGGPYTQIASGVAATSFSDTGLSASTIYFYVVQAVNSAGTSGNSNEASATTPLGPPLAPTNLTATAGNAQVSLSWTISD